MPAYPSKGPRQRPPRQPHTCHWPTCNLEVPPRLWGCKRHWFKLPAHIRSKIWKHYRPGQEIDKNPSQAYIDVALEAQYFAMNNPDV